MTLGPARRRRRMHRQLRELDRWYAEQDGTAGARTRRGLRGFLVGGTTAVVAVLATGHVLHAEGYEVGRTGVHLRHGDGPGVAVGTSHAYHFSAHQPDAPGEPVTYDPCRPVEIVVNDAIAPPGADSILDDAVAELRRATGLDLRLVGRTTEVPRPRRPLRDHRYGRGWSPVLVAWTTPDVVPRLSGRVAGLGGSRPVVDDMTRRATYVTGGVSLDTPDFETVLGRPGGEIEARAIVMHELGHVVGLGHVDDPAELMNADNVGLTTFGPGDLTGLALLGKGRCRG